MAKFIPNNPKPKLNTKRKSRIIFTEEAITAEVRVAVAFLNPLRTAAVCSRAVLLVVGRLCVAADSHHCL